MQLLLALGDLLLQDLFRFLGLAVVLVIFLGVLRRGESRVQRHGFQTTCGIEVIDQLRGGGAPGNGVKVGVDEVAVDPQGFPVAGAGQFLPLTIQLPGGPITEVGEDAENIMGSLFHPLSRIPLSVESVQQGGKAVHFSSQSLQAVLGDGHKTEIQRAAVRPQQ